ADTAPRVDTEGSAASPPAAGKPPSATKPPSPPKAPAAAKAPAAEKPAPNKAAAEKSAVEKPAANKAAAEKPAVEKPAANKGAGEKSAADKSAAEKPAAEPAAPAPRPARKRRNAALTRLEATIAYTFTDASLAERALTHVSGLRGPRNPAGSYQRLEFLGDHVLGPVISGMLVPPFPRANGGELSRRLAELVRKDACADVARVLDLGAAIKLGGSEVRTGGRRRPTILADVCESLIGAVFLDGGYAAAAEFIERFWHERMITPVRPLRDAKTMLQEWAQGRGLPTPTYREVARTGPQHSPEFRVAVELPNRESAEGVGRPRRAGEQAAAAAMLEREGVKVEVGRGP